MTKTWILFLGAIALTHNPSSSAAAETTGTVANSAVTSVTDARPVEGNAQLLVSGVPEIPADLKKRLMQYLNWRSARLMDVTPDGEKVVIATRFASTMQMHLVEQPMGARQQLSFFDEPVSDATFLPNDPNNLLIMQDAGGGEFYQIYRFDRRAGTSKLLTDGKSRYGGLRISDDAKKVVFNSTARNGKDTDVYVAPVEDLGAARLLTQDPGTWSPVDVSPDSKKLLVVQYRAIDDADLHLLDLETSDRQQLSPKEGRGSIGAAVFSHDSKRAYVVTDRYTDFNELYEVDLASPAKEPKPLTRDLKWNVESVKVAPDGSTLVLNVNEEGFSKLYLLDPATGKREVVELPVGLIDGMMFPRKRSDTLFIMMQTTQFPTDVYQLDMGTKKLTRWTKSEVGGIDTSDWANPKLVKYPSTDNLQIPAFVYPPNRAATKGAKAPVVVLFHGGPEGQSRPGFSPFLQMMTRELGCAVVVPNVRGSDGYGKAYLAMDNGVKREASLADIGATLDWIAKQPDLDASRVGVYGGSYGGYMVLASLTFYPERFKAGVDIVGISNLITFLNNTQSYRRDLRRAEYGDERDPATREVLERISPLNSVEKIQAALYVQQGKNDPRVPQSEAEQIVHAVAAKGKPAWYMLALNEGHGFAKKDNRDYAQISTIFFFQQQLQ